MDDQWSPQLSQEISTLLTVLSVRILHLSDHLTKQSHVLGRLRLYLCRCNCDAGVHCHSMQRQIKNQLCDDVCCEQRSLKGHTKKFTKPACDFGAIVSGQSSSELFCFINCDVETDKFLHGDLRLHSNKLFGKPNNWKDEGEKTAHARIVVPFICHKVINSSFISL